MLDPSWYEGREQALVKHTFLDRYLPALIGKVCSRYDEFVYVDGFAGPWQSAAGESFDDTSFGIALNHMTAQRRLYARRGRNVKMRAVLVEKDADAFAQLTQAIARFPEIEVKPLKGYDGGSCHNHWLIHPAHGILFHLDRSKGFSSDWRTHAAATAQEC